MLPSFATWFTGFKTVFVFALRPFLPMWVLFFGFNGNINGKMPPKTPKIGVFGYFIDFGHLPIENPIEAEKKYPHGKESS